MAVRIADSYIDQLFAERDLDSIYQLIGVVSRERTLPEEFWLFCRIFEWTPSRSGSWQYYEGLPEDKFERISQALERFKLSEIAQKYRYGKSAWNGPDQAADLDDWLDTHSQQIHAAIFNLIEPQKDCLRDKT